MIHFDRLGKLADPLPAAALAKIAETQRYIPDPDGLDRPTDIEAAYPMASFDDSVEPSKIRCIADRQGNFLAEIEPAKREADTISFLDDPFTPEERAKERKRRKARRHGDRTTRKPRAGKGGIPRALPIGTAKVHSHSLYFTDFEGKSRKLGVGSIDPNLVDRALQALPAHTVIETVRGVKQSMARIIRKRYKVSARVAFGKFGLIFMGISDDCFQSAITNILLNKVPDFDLEKMRAIARDSARQVIRQATAAGKCPMPYVNIRTKREDEVTTTLIGGQEIKTRRSVETEVSKHRVKGFYKPKALTTPAGDAVGTYIFASGAEERERVRKMMDNLTDRERDVIMTLYRSSASQAVERFGGGVVYNLLGKCRKILIGR